MTTDAEIVEAIALLKGTTVTKIRKRVMTLLSVGLADLHSLVPGFWTKANETFTLGTSGVDAYIVDLKSEFPDFWMLRMLWTDDGEIKWISEKQFRNRHPDPTIAGTGCPSRYLFREKSVVEFWPQNSESRTIHIAYRYKPAFESISIVPEEWRFVLFYYVMGLFEGKDEDYYKHKYADGLVRMQNFAKESEEEHSVIIGDGQDEIIYGEMEESR